jgi:hypothetical protein
MTIPNPRTPCPPSAPLDAERDLIAGIFRQALTDLKATADPYAHASAIRWWRNHGGELQWWCDMLDLDLAQVQRAVAQRYPQVLAPRQLELQLEVPHERRSLDHIA